MVETVAVKVLVPVLDDKVAPTLADDGALRRLQLCLPALLGSVKLDFLLGDVSPRPSPFALPARIPPFAIRTSTHIYQ